ncbi:hypothetical protein [Lonepinella sp. BR2930]|uniref:hypothetical protein n=1 Tax=Lonepinella sp. BR2930 TaxID=3434554 RepID=UPI003F6DF28F
MYQKLKTISSKLIKQFGSPCVVVTENQGQYNPLTGSVSDGERMEQKAYCLFDNLAYDFSRSQQNSSATIEQGDVLIYLTAQAEPTVNSHILVNQERWMVINCQPIKPANTAVIYQCQARKSA